MTLIIGCGNLLRGDDAVGPVVVRRLLDRGLPAGVEVADGGTGGMDVAFRMRGAGAWCWSTPPRRWRSRLDLPDAG
ncbi:MAG: hydrogenase maturation protease [Acidimicrobiales bacterium]